MHRIIRIKAYEAEHGPHFNDEHARKAVNKMENEDGTRGQHWSLEETTALANQYGIRLDEKINKYDWYVALNMVYSDYYRVVVSMTGSNNTKYFVELAKAWMHDKDIDEGKMWFYYIYVMCDKIRNAEEDLFERHYSKYEDDDEEERYGNYRRMGRSSYGRRKEYDREYDERDFEREREKFFPKQLDYQEENLKQEDPRIKELQEQVAELKGLIKQASNMVPPQMKQMLPQNMQKAMNEAS